MNMLLALFFNYNRILTNYSYGFFTSNRFILRLIKTHYLKKLRKELDHIFDGMDVRDIIREFCAFSISMHREIFNRESYRKYGESEAISIDLDTMKIVYALDSSSYSIKDKFININASDLKNRLEIEIYLENNTMDVYIKNLIANKTENFTYNGFIDSKYAETQDIIKEYFITTFLAESYDMISDGLRIIYGV